MKLYDILLENNNYKATSIQVLTNDINSALKQYNNDTRQAFQLVADKYNVDVKSLFNFWNMRDTKTWYGNKWTYIDPNNDMVILNKKPFDSGWNGRDPNDRTTYTPGKPIKNTSPKKTKISSWWNRNWFHNSHPGPKDDKAEQAIAAVKESNLSEEKKEQAQQEILNAGNVKSAIALILIGYGLYKAAKWIFNDDGPKRRYRRRNYYYDYDY